MFGVNETYQRALLQWQRAAAQGKNRGNILNKTEDSY